ncbi:MAG: YchF family ATPase [Candidatus Delongbacteria bacterium]|nr:YchF family ATPase [Candidatus Delongbacteria bacterium]
MKIGLIGLPYSGKTTIFQAIIGQSVDLNHPSLQKNKYIPHIVEIQDERLNRLTAIFNPKKKVPATIEFVDFMGLSQKEDFKGFETTFLNGFKLMDGFVIILKGFEYQGEPSHPLRDLETILSEFQISDQIIIENRLERLEAQIKKVSQPELKEEKKALENCLAEVERGNPLRDVELSDYELKMLRGFQFLTLKPVVVVINVDETQWQTHTDPVQYLNQEWLNRYPAMVISGQIEKDIAMMEEEDSRDFKKDYGITEAATDKMIRASFDLLDRIVFFTVGEDEVRAWPIRRGDTAQRAAGAIHSDIERGFIRAEVIHYQDFMKAGSMSAAKEKGWWRLEGKEYPVKDGDIINFRFSV